MNPVLKIENFSVPQLVARFVDIAMAQHDASNKYETAKYNRLYDQMEQIELELKSRDGDQRSALLPLLEASDIHVRLKAALALLAVAPEPARQTLENIRDFALMPHSTDAILMLSALDKGTYVPS